MCILLIMADIDIEEHDLLQNPMLRKIFPDLSILKKEIIDFDEVIDENPQEYGNSEDSMSNTSLYEKGILQNEQNIPKPLNLSDAKIVLQDVGPDLTKSKRFCQNCLIFFPNDKSSFRHQRTFHKKDLCQNNTSNLINNFDCMVEINDLDLSNNNSSSLITCVHCDILFTTEQSLIDHLYEVLSMKGSKLKSVSQESSNQTKTIVHKSVTITKGLKEKNKILLQVNFLYCCPVCSYYINDKKAYLKHILTNHNITKRSLIKRVKYNPNCKFCCNKYSNVSSHNLHLREIHTHKFIKKLASSSNNQEGFQSINRYYRRKLLMENKNRNIRSNNTINEVNQLNIKDVSIMVLKVILFQCNECQICFLTLKAATSHDEHSKFLSDWQCSTCCRVFKQKDANIHRMQHKHSNYFIISNQTRQTTAAKHVTEINNSDQYTFCDADQPNPIYMKNSKPCQLFEKRKEICKNRFKLRTLNQGCHLYFCNLCKSYMPVDKIADIHYLSSCKKYNKYLCVDCGLTFQTKFRLTHANVHIRNINLKLQDFTFYDLRTTKQIKPSQDLHECITCQKHFICEKDLEDHLCGAEPSLVCPICKIKLSDTAYALHMPFHNYILKMDENNDTHPIHDILELKSVENQIEELNNTNCEMQEVTEYDQNLSSPETRLDSEVLVTYSCINCDVSMNIYDEVVQHCHMHENLNDLGLETIKCMVCNLNFIAATYKQHQNLHSTYNSDQLEHFTFDVLYFGYDNDEWLKHVFGSSHSYSCIKYINDSIYKCENRLKMAITQQGPAALTIYKCDRCQCSINSYSTYHHITSCCKILPKFYCTLCNLGFLDNLSRKQHETIHSSNIGPQSFRIVTFNKSEERISNIKKYYVFYQCRGCHVVVDKNVYNDHKCHSGDFRLCSECGLLIQESHYNLHLTKHKDVKSFNKSNMNVILLGNGNNNLNSNTSNTPLFNGIISDYTFYKCTKCEVCVIDLCSTMQHCCSTNIPKSKCPRCGLDFDELQDHLKFHDTNPNFTKDTLIVKEFDVDNQKYDSEIYNPNVTNIRPKLTSSKVNCIAIQDVTKIYKCPCGLHFLNESTIKIHKEKCSGNIKIKQSKQSCFKCGLAFRHDILFQHLLNHHKGKNGLFKYEIEEI